jgi:hypothetical protein
MEERNACKIFVGKQVHMDGRTISPSSPQSETPSLHENPPSGAEVISWRHTDRLVI